MKGVRLSGVPLFLQHLKVFLPRLTVKGVRLFRVSLFSSMPQGVFVTPHPEVRLKNAFENLDGGIMFYLLASISSYKAYPFDLPNSLKEFIFFGVAFENILFSISCDITLSMWV